MLTGGDVFKEGFVANEPEFPLVDAPLFELLVDETEFKVVKGDPLGAPDGTSDIGLVGNEPPLFEVESNFDGVVVSLFGVVDSPWTVLAVVFDCAATVVLTTSFVDPPISIFTSFSAHDWFDPSSLHVFTLSLPPEAEFPSFAVSTSLLKRTCYKK